MQGWEQREGESDRWYGRFEVYRLMGSSRSIEGAYRRCAEAEGLNGSRPGASWYKESQRWEWSRRAGVWDVAERSRLRAIEQDRRFDARENRLSMIRDMMVKVFGVLVLADLPALEIDEARQMFPMMRLFFKELLMAERSELGLPVVETGVGVGNDQPVFSADTLSVAQRELQSWKVGADSPDGADLYIYDVFLSYDDSADVIFALGWLLPRLRDAGVKVAVDVDTFRPGAPVLEEVERCVMASRYTVAVVTAAWLEDEWSTFEGLLRQHEDVEKGLHRLIPLLIEECELPRRLSALQMVDMRDEAGRDRQLSRVVKMVRA